MKTEGGRVRKGRHKHTDHGPRHPSVRSQESPFPIFPGKIECRRSHKSML